MTSERPDFRNQEPTTHLTPDPESFPKKDSAIFHMQRATGMAAISAALNIADFTGGIAEETDLEKEEKNRRVIKIDTDADSAFQNELSYASIQFFGIDAEGGKEKAADKLGVAMPLAIGKFGQGESKASFVVDVVEGTTTAAHGRPNAISIVGISDFGGITKIPNLDSGEEASYFRKLFAPAGFKNVLSIEKSTHDNLHAIMQTAQIPSEHITVAVMKRNCNATIIRQAQEIGAKVELVTAGDLSWGLRAINSNPEKPIIMLGRGGAQEGSIAAVAARALGATGQLRLVEEEKDIEVVDNGPIWTADEFVPGSPKHSMVIFTAITKNDHFNMQPVEANPDSAIPNSYIVDTMVIDYKGFQKRTKQFSFHR